MKGGRWHDGFMLSAAAQAVAPLLKRFMGTAQVPHVVMLLCLLHAVARVLA